MSADAAEAALGRLILLFGEPKTANVSAWIAEYRLALAGFHDEAISAGFNELLRTRTMRAWPSIGECVAACRAAGSKLGIKPRRLPWEQDTSTWREPTPEEQAKVAELVRRVKLALRSPEPRRSHVPCDRSVFAEREAARRAEEQAHSWRRDEEAGNV